MTQPPGHLVGKMLWLVPRYVEKPGTLIKLGSILSDPENPESTLNLDAIPEILASSQRDATPHVRQYVKAELSNANSVLAKAVPTLPVFSGGLSAEGRLAHDAATTVDAMDVRATVFRPDKAYMEKALTHEAVIAHVRKGMFGTPLYVIVGVATASKLSVKEKQSREHKVAASASVVAPGGVGETEVGLEHQNKAAVEANLDAGECDFAYRVREFVYLKIRGLRDKGDRSAGAMFGQGQSGKPPVGKDVEELPQFAYFEDEDVSLPGFVTLEVPEDQPT